ncbi:MAG: hypothetical protein GY864_08780 [Desulfobacterales bacterium]|nr:hypothetical protein [Desulfobacterales bacterium]
MSKIIHVTSILLICMGIIAVPCFGGETSHYVNGVEGIKVATLPPPGIYYRLYNVFYCADEISDKNGHELDLGYKVKVFAMSHRLLWVSEKKFFGATYFANILFPLVDTDIQINAFGIDESKFGIADIFIEPLALTRYGEKYDLSAGIGVFVPNGK